MSPLPFFVSGKPVTGTGPTFVSRNPATGEVNYELSAASAADVDAAVASAQQAVRSAAWRNMRPHERARIIARIADGMAANADELAAIQMRENGKVIAECRTQVASAIATFRYFAAVCETLGSEVTPARGDYLSMTVYEPMGVIAAITPWNSPLTMEAQKVAPALAAGNAIIVKPSEVTPTAAILVARIAAEAGLPPGILNVVTGLGGDTGVALVQHPGVRMVSFTGGTGTGRAIGRICADRLIPAALELGGKSPNIVFDDANLDDAVKGAVSGIFAASGQTCIAGSRLLLQESIHDQFVERLLAYARTARIGNPMLEDTQVGPVTTPPQYKKILDYIDVAKSEGAELVLGGGASDVGEWFVQPTIFTNVDNRMRIAQEEVFGPVLSVIKFRDQEEAIAIANDTMYGLAAGVWTQNIRRMFTMANAIEAGTVWVNTYRAASYTTPFGGYKNSGVGYESGLNSIRQYLKTKSVWINFDADVPNPFVMRLT